MYLSKSRARSFLPGGLQVVADLIHLDQDMYGMQNDPINMALRRYSGMALTNLTFGDVVNKVQSAVEVLVVKAGTRFHILDSAQSDVGFVSGCSASTLQTAS